MTTYMIEPMSFYLGMVTLIIAGLLVELFRMNLK